METNPYKGLEVSPSSSPFDDDEKIPDQYDAWWADEHGDVLKDEDDDDELDIDFDEY